MDKNDYMTTSYSGTPFTEEELQVVSDAVKKYLVTLAKAHFPRNAKLTANAMIGAVASLTKMANSIDAKRNRKR